MNPSACDTLHTLFQPVYPLPKAGQKLASRFNMSFYMGLASLADTPLWDVWRYLARTRFLFRVFFGIVCFLMGFPPEMAIFFDEYNHEIFTSRTHTASLMKLICCLDEACPYDEAAVAVRGVQKVAIMSGYFDFVTGVYLSNDLCDAINRGELKKTQKPGECVKPERLSVNAENSACSTPTEPVAVCDEKNVTVGGSPKCEHVVFRMGSHFILLEWPEHIAAQLVRMLDAYTGSPVR